MNYQKELTALLQDIKKIEAHDDAFVPYYTKSVEFGTEVYLIDPINFGWRGQHVSIPVNGDTLTDRYTRDFIKAQTMVETRLEEIQSQPSFDDVLLKVKSMLSPQEYQVLIAKLN